MFWFSYRRDAVCLVCTTLDMTQALKTERRIEHVHWTVASEVATTKLLCWVGAGCTAEYGQWPSNQLCKLQKIEVKLTVKICVLCNLEYENKCRYANTHMDDYPRNFHTPGYAGSHELARATNSITPSGTPCCLWIESKSTDGGAAP